MDSVISLVQCQDPLCVCRAAEDNLIAKYFWWQNWPAGDNTVEKTRERVQNDIQLLSKLIEPSIGKLKH